MKYILSNLFVLFIVLVTIQNVSAIPASVTEVSFDSYEMQSIIDRHRASDRYGLFSFHRYSEEERVAFAINRYEGSSRYSGYRSKWRARFKFSRFGTDAQPGTDAMGDVPLNTVDNLLRSDPITVTSVDECCNFFEEIDDYDRGVDVPEPALAVLIALGLVGFGLARGLKH